MPSSNFFQKNPVASSGTPTAGVPSQGQSRAFKVPSPLPIPELESIKDEYPGVCGALQSLQSSQEATSAYLTRLEGNVGQKPRPPLDATVSLGFAPSPHLILTWRPDSESETPVEYYKIYREGVGNSIDIDTQIFEDADFILPVFAQDRAYLVDDSRYSVVDDTISDIAFVFPGSPSVFAYWISSVDRFGRESHPAPCSGSPITLVPDVTQSLQFYQPGSSLNQLYNGKMMADVTATALLATRAVSGATNAAPIKITTSADHDLAAGDRVLVSGVAGNPAANGYWTISLPAGGLSTEFTLNGSSGNGAYTTGGTVYRAATQPPPQGPRNSSGNYAKSLWYLISGTAPTFTAGITDIGSGLKLTSGNTCAIGQDIAENSIFWTGGSAGDSSIFVTMLVTTDSTTPASSGSIALEFVDADGWSTATWAIADMEESVPNYVSFPLYGAGSAFDAVTLQITITNPGCNIIISDVMLTAGYQPKPFTEIEEPHYAGLGQAIYQKYYTAASSISPPY